VGVAGVGLVVAALATIRTPSMPGQNPVTGELAAVGGVSFLGGLITGVTGLVLSRQPVDGPTLLRLILDHDRALEREAALAPPPVP
jgi:hypothetical protein